MKVASFALIFSLFLFLCTAAISYTEASETASLNLRGQVPHYFGVEYVSTAKGMRVKPRANFNFYGEVIEREAILEYG
ncbi:hypothetical protein, partial [Bacteriovorax sp. DB6_IX]|uniref:hypothetical protein n=1 Tax=Bacteriovorax sp. DB6_IX TaxID=1353530 RepID=UPI00038A4626